MRLRAAAALVLAMTGAGNAQGLAGSEWRPLDLEGVPVPADSRAFVRFEAEGRIAGDGGCNRFTGHYTVEGATLAIGPLAATRRACPPPTMAFEDSFLTLLGRAAGFVRNRADLTLTDTAGLRLMALRQTDWD